LSEAFAEAGRRWREERLRLFVVGARVCARSDFDWCTGEQISQSALGIVTSLDEDPDFCFVRWAPLGGAPLRTPFVELDPPEPRLLADDVVLDPSVALARPVIEGSRAFVETVVYQVGSGRTAEQVARQHGVSLEAVLAAVSYAASLVDHQFAHLESQFYNENRRALRNRQAMELRSAISAALAIRSMLLSEAAEDSLRTCGDPDLLTACLVSIVKGASEDRVIEHLVGIRLGFERAAQDALHAEARAARQQAAASDYNSA
jgi:uncharacterized protein (DUF433 family)